MMIITYMKIYLSVISYNCLVAVQLLVFQLYIYNNVYLTTVRGFQNDLHRGKGKEFDKKREKELLKRLYNIYAINTEPSRY